MGTRDSNSVWRSMIYSSCSEFCSVRGAWILRREKFKLHVKMCRSTDDLLRQRERDESAGVLYDGA